MGRAGRRHRHRDGKHRPRQLGTYPSQRAARRALAELLERGAADSAVRAEKGTVAEFIKAWAAAKVDVSAKSHQQYDWAASHIRKGLGGIPLDQLTREDVETWIDQMAAGGEYARRSIQVFRMVLRAALDEAVAEGRLRRSPAARVGMPRQVMKPDRVREVPAWTADDVRTFLAAIKDVAGSLDAHVVLEPVLPRPVPCRRLELGAESCGFRDAPRPERAIR